MRAPSLHPILVGMLLASILFIIPACRQDAVAPPSDRAPLDRKLLLGTWLLTSSEAMYSSISFRPDSQVVLGCRFCDTVFHYRYIVTDSSLIFTSLQTDEPISNDVVEHQAADTLLFRTLLSHRSPQRYHR